MLNDIISTYLTGRYSPPVDLACQKLIRTVTTAENKKLSTNDSTFLIHAQNISLYRFSDIISVRGGNCYTI